jgi:hypothetical protein
MRNSLTFAALGLCGLAVTTPFSAGAQATLDPATRILIAAAQKARSTITPPGRFTIEVSGLPAESNQAITVAKLVRAELGTLKDVLRCDTSPSSCRLTRTDAFVRLTMPNVTGDTVSVPATLWQQTDNSREPIHRQELDIQVVRHGLSWVVSDMRVKSQS